MHTMQPEAACNQAAHLLYKGLSLRLTRKQADPNKPVTAPISWETVAPDFSQYSLPQTLSFNSPMFQGSHIHRRLQLGENIGEGSYGKVYRGKYVGECGHVAVKGEAATRAHRSIQSHSEAYFLSQGDGHPNAVRMRDFFSARGFL